MYTYPMRALSKSGKEVVEFRMEDGPCWLDGEHFFLSKRPGTPILRYSSILRGSDVEGIFEGDVYEVNGKNFMVCYRKGMYAVSEDRKETLSLNDVKYYTKTTDVYQNPDLDLEKVSRYMFKYKSMVFNLSLVMGEADGNLILNANGVMVAPIQEIQQYAGTSYKRKSLYFGDTLDGGKLALNNGKICLLKNGEYVEYKREEV